MDEEEWTDSKYLFWYAPANEDHKKAWNNWCSNTQPNWVQSTIKIKHMPPVQVKSLGEYFW
jgi:hypothetical protein